MASMNPPSRGGPNVVGASEIVGGEANELRLARFLDGLDRVAKLLAFAVINLLAVVAHGVPEVEVEMVGTGRLQPLVQVVDELLGTPRLGLADEENLLADLGFLGEPRLEVPLRAVGRGRVVATDAVGVRHDESGGRCPRPSRSLG